MKKKSLLLCSTLAFLSVGALTGCGQNSNTIIVWVGSESVSFYRDQAKEFLKNNPDFGYSIGIIGADTGGAAGQMVSDNTACGDIVTIAHDNIGKLSESSLIAPIVDEDLLKQIDEDNPKTFKDIIKNYLGQDKDHQYTFAVPYISQALFLYYDTRYVTEQQADSFEGLIEAAQKYDKDNGVSGTKAFTVTGTDGFNNSFSLMARKLVDPNDPEKTEASVRLYGRGSMYDCYAQDNDQVAIMKWYQRMYEHPNGVLLELKGTPWNTCVENHLALSAIGGAWHFNAFQKAVGEPNIGCKILPTFTLTEEDVAGIEDKVYPMDDGATNMKGVHYDGLPQELQGAADAAPVAGTKFRGGSFVDCKAFVINMAKMTGAEKYGKMCDLIQYFSSKDVQKQSFLKCLNVPAFDQASDFIESVKDQVDHAGYLMAKAQTGMSIYGFPQPILNAAMNTNYYQKKAPDFYANCIKKEECGTSVDSIREILFRMEYVWKHGGLPSKPYPALSELPAETSGLRNK